MATGPDLTSSSAADAAASSAAKKDRHIVSWSAQEDDVLRAQIAHHGTDNWTVIATQFKDKTARQCRRRWYNYLNTECKKGGWSREEDMLLCEAQKLLGNKWTEIAKVVSGRTDNAVKNRFSTLCKRRAKDDELFEENGTVCSNASAKRVLTQSGGVTCAAPGSSPPIKNMSSCKPDFKENIAPNMKSFAQQKSIQQDSRQPLASICPDNQSVNIVKTQSLVTKTSTKQLHGEEQSCVKHEGNFLKRNDPKLATLLQQADLLSSLATKVNTENTSQSMDEAWQKLQHHLVKKDDNDMSESSMSGTASLLDDLDDLIVDPYENEEEDEQKSREQNGATSQMAPDQIMDNCPVDQIAEESSLCGNTLSSTMEPCPVAEILAHINLGEAAEDMGLHFMEYSSPTRAAQAQQAKADAEIPASVDLSESAEVQAEQAKADAEIPVSVDLSEAAEGSWSQFMEYTSPAHTVLHAEGDAETPASVKLREAAEGSLPQCMEHMSPAHTLLRAKRDSEIPASANSNEAAEGSWSQFMEYMSPAHIVLHAKADAETPASVNLGEAAEGSLPQCMEPMSPAHTLLRAKTGYEIPASANLSEAAKYDSLQCTECTSPARADLQAKADAEISENFSEVAQHSRLQCAKFTSLAHTASKGKAVAKKGTSENCSDVPEDSSTQPCMEFTSPAHTVPTFHPFTDNVPTPKITASERNFLLSVLELASPGSKPETSQQPSCKRALLNSL
ncbi:transcription factor MYB88-like isoform X3 [Triticum urartu]|uniref:Myb-related protein B n=1 Tax=Triticum urartu TaxID=4572 RepID=A0A8R7TEG1_TRIUA|nr:transcription factor MYB88-like isoform X3 [Triticum urartu]XP_048555255.1 transcription factor MYB88-like isoform X3 [Triticum urartu]